MACARRWPVMGDLDAIYWYRECVCVCAVRAWLVRHVAGVIGHICDSTSGRHHQSMHVTSLGFLWEFCRLSVVCRVRGCRPVSSGSIFLIAINSR